MMANPVKRPFITEPPRGSTIIDLTSDNEDAEPPSKRQRSESYPAPRIPPSTKPLNAHTTKKTAPNAIDGISSRLSNSTLSNHNFVRDNAGKSYIRSPHESFARTGTASGATKPNQNGAVDGLPHSNAIRPSTLTTAVPTTAVPRHTAINGNKDLAYRSSPNPSSTSRSKSSGSHEVTDLDTNSDRVSRRSESAATRNGISSAYNIPPETESPKSPGFVLPNTQTIRFDPLSKQSQEISLTQKSSAPKVEVSSSQGLPKQIPKIESDVPQKSDQVRKPEVRVNLPPSQQEIIRKLKEDPDYIEKNPGDVFKVLRFNPLDTTDLTKDLHEKVRQKKHQRPINRDQVLLDLGTEPALPLTTKRIRFINPQKQAQSILNKRFEQGDLLTFQSTSKNDRRPNGKFQFISEYVFGRRAQTKSQTPHSLRTCSCMSDFGECTTDCSCLTSHLTTKVNDEDVSLSVKTYQRHPYLSSLIVLSDTLIEDTTHTVKIFECGDSCRCPKECINRVVQRGRTIPLQVFDTGKYGFGIRSSTKILRGQFIDIYLGEVLTEGEVSKREAAAEEDTPSYIMSLDAFITDEKAMFYIDGENFGSVTRFVNHSCEPNCKIIPVVQPKGTKHVYHVAFFAIKDIEAETELTIDYDPDLLDEDDEVIVEGVVRCQCGSAKCRKRLWAPGKEKRGRRKKYLPSRDDD